jgi:hypothetical protein
VVACDDSKRTSASRRSASTIPAGCASN